MSHASDQQPPGPSEDSGRASGEQRAERLKERVYVTFSTLAVTLALQVDVEHGTPGTAARTLLLGVLGTLVAVFVADVVAHVTVHRALPDREAFGQMVAVSAGSLGVLVLPLVFVGAAGLGWIELTSALTASSFTLIATLILVGWIAVRRLRLPILQKLLVLLAEGGLGLLVIALQSVTH